eukprot:TRINITY_DN19447_c0_g1_i1.p1 TRINITY_DN19447_c0_g1~~TRINITY_DN19447_c0_g1_i1.p1  ORF type:complete len:612 (-),score=108.93 TRINITY_DN19447_c0_g1_i1:214-2049(-)
MADTFELSDLWNKLIADTNSSSADDAGDGYGGNPDQAMAEFLLNQAAVRAGQPQLAQKLVPESVMPIFKSDAARNSSDTHKQIVAEKADDIRRSVERFLAGDSSDDESDSASEHPDYFEAEADSSSDEWAPAGRNPPKTKKTAIRTTGERPAVGQISPDRSTNHATQPRPESPDATQYGDDDFITPKPFPGGSSSTPSTGTTALTTPSTTEVEEDGQWWPQQISDWSLTNVWQPPAWEASESEFTDAPDGAPQDISRVPISLDSAMAYPSAPPGFTSAPPGFTDMPPPADRSRSAAMQEFVGMDAQFGPPMPELIPGAWGPEQHVDVDAMRQQLQQQRDAAEANVRQTLADMGISVPSAVDQGGLQQLTAFLSAYHSLCHDMQSAQTMGALSDLHAWEAASGSRTSELNDHTTAVLAADDDKPKEEPSRQEDVIATSQETLPTEIKMARQDASSPQKLIADMVGRGATTVMMRNLPTTLNQPGLLNTLDSSGFKGKYDFAYMPSSFQTNTGKGYAFINLISSDAVAQFVEFWWNSRHFCGTYTSALPLMPISVSAATVQGVEDNTRKWNGPRSSRVRNPALRPFVMQRPSTTTTATMGDSSSSLLVPSTYQ